MPSYNYKCDQCGAVECHQHAPAERLSLKCCGHLMAWQFPAPALRTNTTFLANRGTLDKQFGTDTAGMKKTLAAAKRRGHTPNMNDVYMPTLCAPGRPGDPEAFIPADDPVGYVKRLCKKRNWACDDDQIKAKRSQRPPPPRVPMAEKIVRARVNEAVARDPSLATKRARLREEIIEKHSRK